MTQCSRKPEQARKLALRELELLSDRADLHHREVREGAGGRLVLKVEWDRRRDEDEPEK